MLMIPTGENRQYKQRILTFKDKIELIKYSENHNISVRNLAKKFTCGRTQAYNILKNKDKLKEEWFSGARSGDSKRRLRTTENQEINCMLYDWYVDAKSRNLPITGPLLQSQAKIIAAQIGRSNFKASSGWLERFRIRHGISLYSSKVKAQAACLGDINDWKAKLKDLVKDYNIENIASCDETALLYRVMPDKAIDSHESVDERLTLLLCAFADGTVEPPLVIGNSKMENVNLMWRYNEQAWMTTSIMEEWLNLLNERFKQQDRKIILFLDGVASHPRLKFSHIQLCFIPPNCNDVHPMNHIIFNFKATYRKLLLDHVIDCSENITLDDALTFIERAYVLDMLYVRNSFSKCGFPVEYQTEYLLKKKLLALWKMIRTLDGDITADEYVNIDRTVASESGFQTVNDLIQARETKTAEETIKQCRSPSFTFGEVTMDGYIKVEPFSEESDVLQYKPEDELAATLPEDSGMLQFEPEQEQRYSSVDTSGDDSLRSAVEALVQNQNKLMVRVQQLEKEAVMNKTLIAKLQERITVLENPNHEI